MPPPPPLLSAPKARFPYWLWTCVIGLLVGMSLLFAFDPSGHGFYPQCFFQKLTGWSCPGCGGLRAAHQLLHGHVRQAFQFNPLLVVGGPLVGGWLGYALWAWTRHRRVVVINHIWVWGLLIIAVGFGVWRNLA